MIILLLLGITLFMLVLVASVLVITVYGEDPDQ